jgi:hypothetical protein
MRFRVRVRRVARDGPLQQACLPSPSDLTSTLSAQPWVTGRADGANNRRRREGDSGQNAEPTSSARTKPGPSAMVLNNRCRRRALPRRASLFAEPALTAGDARRASPALIRSLVTVANRNATCRRHCKASDAFVVFPCRRCYLPSARISHKSAPWQESRWRIA